MNARWLLLIHQLPPNPSNLRVKTWRRLQSVGAVAMKNSVYVLPAVAEAREDFEWVVREIRKEGGEASLCQAALLEGTSDGDLEAAFIDAREKDYRELADEVRGVRDAPGPTRGALARLRKRFRDIASLDFFEAPGRQTVDGLLRELESRLDGDRGRFRDMEEPKWNVGDVSGRRWVTRRGIRIDRIASAWLIRRFIDPSATFKYVEAEGYVPVEGELRFDMFEAEFTHDGDLCTFEVLLRDFALADSGLRAIAEIVHDIDLKDSKYGRPETIGIAHTIAGIARKHEEDDDARLEQGSTVFDALHAYLAPEPR